MVLSFSSGIYTKTSAASRGEEPYMSVRFDNIVGNEALCSRLADDVGRGTLAHAYIVEGPVGSGRKTLILSLLCALSCSHSASDASIPCGKCKSCRKILEGGCPDVISIGLESDRTTLGVDTIRRVKNDVYTAPNDLDIKAYIIEDAELMTEQAQNAFLLLLESPPPYALFFLVCQNSTSLLETVRSRAPTLRLERLALSSVERYLLENDKRAVALSSENPDEFHSAVFCGEGSIGASLALLDGKRRSALLESKASAKEIIALLSGRDKSAAFELISTLKDGKRADICRKLSTLEVALRDLIMLKKSDDAHLCFFESRDEASELATHYSLSSLFALYDASSDARAALEANANARLTLIHMMQAAGII